MKKRLKSGILVGTSVLFISIVISYQLGFNQRSFLVISYLLLISPIFSSVFHDLRKAASKFSINDLSRNVLLVVDEEEMKLKKLTTGEYYKIKGNVEKVQ